MITMIFIFWWWHNIVDDDLRRTKAPQLILVTIATTGGGVLFQAGVPFSSEHAKGTAFSKVHSENININPHIFLMKMPDTPTQVECSISCNKCTIPMQRIPSTPTKIASTPTKTASTPNIDLRCFVAMKFLLQISPPFLAYIFYRPKLRRHRKNNMRYAFGVAYWQFTWVKFTPLVTGLSFCE